MTTREELSAAIAQASTNLTAAKNALQVFESKAENNVFESLDKALGTVEDKLYRQAAADCEGSYNCGAPSYTQDFMVGEIRYRGTLTVEYNRHDKTYYYIDRSEFSYAQV